MIDLFQIPCGHLPVKYLGVPLITSRLSYTDCKPLVDSITARIRSWTVKFLPFTGRLQLIKSIICSIQSFWNSLFVLPKRIINQVEQIIRRFLWKGPTLAKGGAKVAWDDVTYPLEEGGLGIRRLHTWNVASMGTHLWSLCIPSPTSGWAQWARANLLQGHSLWDVSIPTNSSWIWRKLLKMRTLFRNQIKHIVGDGNDTWLWFDDWLPLGPIQAGMGNRVIYDVGLPRTARVSAIVRENSWHWPIANSPELLILKETTISIPPPDSTR